MSIEINHEKVAKKLALEIADLKYQVTAYATVVEDMQQTIQSQETKIAQFENDTREETHDE